MPGTVPDGLSPRLNRATASQRTAEQVIGAAVMLLRIATVVTASPLLHPDSDEKDEILARLSPSTEKELFTLKHTAAKADSAMLAGQ